MAKNKTVYLRGKIYWAKIFGEPRPNYNRDGREWTFEFEPDDLEEANEVLPQYKRPQDKSDRKGYEDRGPFMTFKHKELNSRGEPNDPIRVVNAAGGAWPDGTLVGNGSTVDVKINIVDYGPGKKEGVYANAIRVMDLVPYQSSDFKPVDEDDPLYEKAVAAKDTFAKDFGLEPDKEDLEDNPVSPPVGDEVKPKDVKKRKAAVAAGDSDLDDDVPEDLA